MKIEKRGKFGGVKIHLEPDECQVLLDSLIKFEAHPPNKHVEGPEFIAVPASMSLKMGKKIRDLMQEEPNLLGERSQEEIIAILAKESEKARLQLEQAKKGSGWEKVDPSKLQQALLKHVK